jgi:myosin-1
MKQGNKERRRISLERSFSGDYVNYRENFELKAVVASYDKNEKVSFSHAINKYDRRGRPQRRILLLSEAAIYIVAVEKNKNKEEFKKKPWIYALKRRLLLSNISGLEMSKLSDNFVLLKSPNEHDNLIECKRKTEFVGTLMKYVKNVRINFSNA